MGGICNEKPDAPGVVGPDELETGGCRGMRLHDHVLRWPQFRQFLGPRSSATRRRADDETRKDGDMTLEYRLLPDDDDPDDDDFDDDFEEEWDDELPGEDDFPDEESDEKDVPFGEDPDFDEE